jgi:peptidyl-dipeptidase Dcp
MRKLSLVLTLAVAVLFSACTNQKEEKKEAMGNPFFSKYNTEFEVPPFEELKSEHYMPAFNKGMAQHNEEIKAIVDNSEAPTFENTVLAYDNSGKLLGDVSSVFFNLTSAETTDDLQKIAQEVTPLLSKHSTAISLNEGLFKRIKEVYNKRNESNLDDQQIRVVEKIYKDFERNGANLEGEAREQLKKLNEDLSVLTMNFGNNVREETNSFLLVVDNEKDLAGLPEGVVSAAAETAAAKGETGKWVFTLQKPSLIPFLQYAENRELRETLYKGYLNRGNNDNEFDNKEILAKITDLRAQKAALLGYKDHATYVIENNMAKTPEKVYEFLNDLWSGALPKAKQELKEMQAIADREGAKFQLDSWDWWFYAEKLRKEKYDLDEEEIKPYFSLDNVTKGVFHVCNELYGINFKKIEGIQTYHEEASAYEVTEADGSHIGVLYMDFHPREGKRVGAWCTRYRDSHYEGGKKVAPVVSIVCNFTRPTGDKPALLNFDEVTTYFHEFGHALHGLFTDGKYKRTAGVVPRDYVELPSQIMENWAGEPEVLKVYAKHYKTGEVIPDALIEKIQKSGHFNQGFATTEYLAASLLDLDYHTYKGDFIKDVNAFEANQLGQKGLIKEIESRYKSTYFNHIFSGGYSAGYYVYIWAAVLDTDAFNAFKESGDIYNKELADKFRKHCLSEVGSDEGMVQYKKFRGQDPDPKYLKAKRGLLVK